MPLIHPPLLAARLSLAWARRGAAAWAVASQQRSRRNAMVAATRMAQHRVDAQEAEDYVAGHPSAAPAGAPARDAAHA